MKSMVKLAANFGISGVRLSSLLAKTIGQSRRVWRVLPLQSLRTKSELKKRWVRPCNRSAVQFRGLHYGGARTFLSASFGLSDPASRLGRLCHRRYGFLPGFVDASNALKMACSRVLGFGRLRKSVRRRSNASNRSLVDRLRSLPFSRLRRRFIVPFFSLCK